MGSEKTELLGVCQPHDRFLLFLSNRLMLIINSGIDLISLDPFGYSWFHSPSIHGFRPIIFHQTLEVLRFAPTERGSTILVYMPRAPRRMKGQVLMIFCQNPKSYWISVYVVFSKWCSYQVAKKSCHQNFSHFEFWSHRSSPCGFGVFDAHFPWLADQLMLSRCGLWQAWIPRPYSFNQFNPSLRWSTRIDYYFAMCFWSLQFVQNFLGFGCNLLRMISWTIHSCLFWFRDSEPIDRADSHSSHCVWELQNIQFMSGWCFSFFNSFSSGF